MSVKKVTEKIVSGAIACSGFVTSVAILLIVVFLFSEGLGLFSQKTIEEGYALVVNKGNPVDELDARQIKEVFDEDVTNWRQVGGEAGPIMVFRFEDLPRHVSGERLGPGYENAAACIDSIVGANRGIIAFVPEEFAGGSAGKALRAHRISPGEVLGGSEWFPTATPAAQFGFLPLVLGTVWVTVFAILFALPFGLSVAIYMSEVASARMRNVLKPVIELLSGIPSVVYGFFGLIVVVPLLQNVFGLPVGESGLAGAIVLAVCHGSAHDNNRQPGRHAELPALATRGEPGSGGVQMADHLQSGDALLHLRHHLRRGAGHRPRLRRDHGRAHGNGQRRRHSARHHRPAAHDSRHHSRRAGRGARRRSPLPVAVPARRGALLHHAGHQLVRGIHIIKKQISHGKQHHNA